MEEFNEIELKIKEILERIAKEDSETGGIATTEWTRMIKSEICKLGKERKYGVCSSGYDGADDGEWLFDLIWCYSEGDPPFFLEMPLGLGCEWSFDDHKIWWDFEKLLIARTKYRVFIFNKKTSKEVENLMIQFEKAINKFRGTQSGDRYLLAGYSKKDKKFLIKNWIAHAG